MKPNRKTLFLLDGNALLHRAWHAIPPLTTKDGLVVNAVYGFTNIVEKLRDTYKPEYMAVAWDLPGKTFRHEVFKTYKAQRVKKEQALYDQIPIIQELMNAYHVSSYDAPGYEADDVIGTITEMMKKKIDVVIVTGDMDAFQLIDDRVSVLTFVKGVSEMKLYDEKTVFERFQLNPLDLIEFKALRGDTSDNIPGIAGIGEKGALELVQKYHTTDGILHALEKGVLDEKFAKKIRGNEDVLKQARMLVEIVRNIHLDFNLNETEQKIPDSNILIPLFEKYEFRSLIKKYTNTTSQKNKTNEKKEKYSTEILHDVKSIEQSVETMSQSIVGVYVATQSPDLFGEIISAIAFSDGIKSFVVPNPKTNIIEIIGKKFSQVKMLVVPDQKALVYATNWNISSPIFDLSVAAYVLNAGVRNVDLPSILSGVLGEKSIEIPTTFVSEKDYKKIGEIVLSFPSLEKNMRDNLKKDLVENVFNEIETPLIPILVDMEKNGIELDRKNLERFSKILTKDISVLEKKILLLSGVDFNISSPSQLAEVLFDKLQIPTKNIKRTKTGFSTAAPELEKLWDEHEIIPLISEYREFTKLQSTYVDSLPKLVARDGRIHTTFNQTVTSTGRLSSSDPNLQNIPIRTELGREIRKAFVASKQNVLISADYSQIELRLISILANDRPFVEAFKEGSDIHTRTAAEVWDIKEENVTKDQRRAAKAINFGILYGMGPRSLSRSTGLSMIEAKQFIVRYFEIHHAVRDFLDDTKIKAHDLGYVETYFHRRRYLPEIHSGVQMLVAQAERMAINMPVQGTAADLMKMAMLAVHGWLKQSHLHAKMLLQVHDELVLEVSKDEVTLVCNGLKEMMESVAKFEVPLVVDIKVGKNWGDMDVKNL